MGDGIYVINYNSILMVKMLQFKPNGNIFIKSLNSEFDSYELEKDTQENFLCDWQGYKEYNIKITLTCSLIKKAIF